MARGGTAGDGVDAQPVSIDGEALAVGDRVVGLGRVEDKENLETGMGGMGFNNKFNGGFADFMLMSPQWCVKVPDHVSPHAPPTTA